MDIATILSLIEFAINEEPKVATAIKNVITKTDPTPADWQAERDAWAADDYNTLVPDSQLKDNPPTV